MVDCVVCDTAMYTSWSSDFRKFMKNFVILSLTSQNFYGCDIFTVNKFGYS